MIDLNVCLKIFIVFFLFLDLKFLEIRVFFLIVNIVVNLNKNIVVGIIIVIVVSFKFFILCFINILFIIVYNEDINIDIVDGIEYFKKFLNIDLFFLNNIFI